MRFLLFALALAFAAPAAAQFYVCDERGYFSDPSKGTNCRLQESHERVNQPANPPAAPEAPRAPAAAPGQYPVVSADLQRLRDKKRGRILLRELQLEQKRRNLVTQQIQSTQSATPADPILLAHLQEQLHIHAQNIVSIQQELARLK